MRTHRLAITGRSLPGWFVALGAIGAALMGLELIAPVHFTNLGARAAIEATITICALGALGLWFTTFEQTRRRRDLAPLVALGAVSLADLTFFAFPTLMGLPAVNMRAPVTVIGELLACAMMLALAAAVFVRRHTHNYHEPALLIGGSVLLAGACLQYLLVPVIATDWVTPVGGLRLIAYGVLFAAAIRQRVWSRDEAAREALMCERERIARDLHDGLAQDLAFIAAHGERFADELGADHPVAVAARRALAASRGTMVDLSASSAPSTEAALRHVSHELTRRFEIRVNVSVLREGSGGSLEPAPLAREQLVRIAREAIVNAVKHGGAANVDVELDLRGRRLSLRISDDGCGMEQARVSVCEQPGFGLPSMRARAESLGGRLLTRRGAQGGTEIELLIR